MTLFSLMKKNMLGNFKSYLLYFCSMIFSVVIYFTFVSLRFSPDIQSSIESWDVMESVFFQASLLLILFVSVFILYSNSFFTKKRKKEVGLYSLFGVRKKTIGKLLFYENLIMGVAAIVVGIILGAILSKLFAMILLKLMDIPVNISFGIPMKAIINTMGVFLCLIIFTSIQAYRLIFRFSLIHLFQAENRGEQVPRVSIISAGMAVILLGASYWIIFEPIIEQPRIQLLLFLVGLVNGTFLLFRSLIVLILKATQKNKTSYYKGMNLITTSQLLYRVKGYQTTLTMISLLSAVTLCAISVGYGSYYNVEKSAVKFMPFSYSHFSKNDNFDRQVERIIENDEAHPVTAKLDIPIITVKGNLSRLPYTPYGYKSEDVPVNLISVATFNQIQKSLQRDEIIQLAGNEVAAIRPWQDNTAEDYSNQTLKLNANEDSINLTIEKMMEDRILYWSSPDMNFVVSNELFAELGRTNKSLLLKSYKVKDEKTTEETANKLIQLGKSKSQLSTFYGTYKNELQSSGMDIFLLGFLGLVFLAATGSIIYFKQLSEAQLDQSRYKILRKIGVSKKQILKSVAMQILFVFTLPFMIGILHCIVILKAIFGVDLMEANILVPVLASFGAYLLIYLLYYLFTVNSFNKIVNS